MSGASTACLLAAELNSNMARIRAHVLAPPTSSSARSPQTTALAEDGGVAVSIVPPGAEAWLEALGEQKALTRTGGSSLLSPQAVSQRAAALQWMSSLDAPLPRVKW
jgi:hypothetical protein